MCLTLKFCNDFLVNFYTCSREYFVFVANRLLFLSLSHLFSTKTKQSHVSICSFFCSFFFFSFKFHMRLRINLKNIKQIKTIIKKTKTWNLMNAPVVFSKVNVLCGVFHTLLEFYQNASSDAFAKTINWMCLTLKNMMSFLLIWNFLPRMKIFRGGEYFGLWVTVLTFENTIAALFNLHIFLD